MKVVFTGSSLMHINRARGDLSRRAVMYELAGLSFREYLNLILSTNFPSMSFSDLIKNHTSIARDIVKEIRPLAHFSSYLTSGYYPYFIEDTELYPQKLRYATAFVIKQAVA